MVSRNFFRFNTTNIISAETDNEDILDEAVEWCDRYELLFSRVDPASELFRLNSAEGRPTAVDAELAAFIETALSYCREVDGLFDVTMGSATQLWNFKDCMIPARDDVAAALRHVDYRGVIVNDAVVTLRDPLACVDLGGIAKGYIADGILALLRERGVEHALVNLGGNVAVMGGKPDGAPWRVGVRRPLPSSSMPLLDSFAVLALRDGSAVTSGIYERAFEQDGKLYHHILDPRTGFPAGNRPAERHGGRAELARCRRVHHRAYHDGSRSRTCVRRAASGARSRASHHRGRCAGHLRHR